MYEQKIYDSALFQLKDMLKSSVFRLYKQLNKDEKITPERMKEIEPIIEDFVNMLLATQIQLFNRNSDLISKNIEMAKKSLLPIIPFGNFKNGGD